jgi:hypothetical protein
MMVFLQEKGVLMSIKMEIYVYYYLIKMVVGGGDDYRNMVNIYRSREEDENLFLYNITSKLID